MTFPKSIIMSLMVIASVFTASGQQTDTDTTKQKKLEEVSITGKTAIRKIKEQAFNINVVDLTQLYNTSADLNQVLNRTTGVRIREDGGLGSTFNFSLNGFTGKQVKFFLDGLPMDNFGSALTLNNFPTTMAERVEIYKGVLPVSLGADALGGAVNIVTRTNANYLDVSYGYGSFNTQKAGINGAYTDKRTGFTVRTNAFYNYSDNNYKVLVQPIDLATRLRGPAQEVERFHDQYRSVGALLEVGVSGKAFADHLLIGVLGAANNKDIQTGVIMDQVFGARTSQSHSVIPNLKYKKSSLFMEGLDLTVYGAYNLTANRFIDTTRLQFNWLQETIPTTTAEFLRTQLKNQDNESLASANLSYGLNDNHALSLNYVLTDFRRKSSDVEDSANPTFLLPQRLRKQTLGLAWQTTYERFTATAFGKLYALQAESFENVSRNNEPDYRFTKLDRTNGGYGIAAAYFLLPGLQAKASYEHTYRLPEAMELLGDGLYIRRNSKLRPENSDNVNVGALYSLIADGMHNWAVEGNFVFRNASDYIRQDQQQSQPIDRQYINVGDVRTTGGEAELRYSWKNRLFASVNATYQDINDRTEFLVSENLTGRDTVRNLNFGHRLPNMPYLFANANFGVRIHPLRSSDNVLSLNYGLSYVENYYLTPNHIGANNTDIIPRQIAHDLLADYVFGSGRYTIALECRNLINSRLFDNYRLQKPGRSFFIKLRYFLTP